MKEDLTEYIVEHFAKAVLRAPTPYVTNSTPAKKKRKKAIYTHRKN